MKVLRNTDTLELITSSAADIDSHVDFVDVDLTSQNPENPDYEQDAIVSATTTTVCTGPASGKARLVKGGSWRNKHASTPNTVTLQINGAITAQLIQVPLAAGDELVMDDRGVFFVHDPNGAVKVGASAASDTVAGLVRLATQADMEAATDVASAVVPGRVHFHPGVAKCWVDAIGAGTGINASYNITSVSDTGTGRLGVNIATDFATANYCIVATLERTVTSLAVAGVEDHEIRNASQLAGSFEVESYDHTATTMVAQDPSSYYAVAFGDQ